MTPPLRIAIMAGSLWAGALTVASVPPAAIPVTAAADDPLVVVVNRANAESSITSAMLRQFVLGVDSRWADGRRATFVLREAGSSERDAVLRLCHLDEAGYVKTRLQMTFKGETGEPKTVTSSRAVVRFLYNVPGAVGVIRASDVDDSVKVVRLDGMDARDPHYPLTAR